MTSSHQDAPPCQWFSRLASALDRQVRPQARPALPRRRPGPRPADRHQLDPRRRAERPVPALLHDRRRGRQAGRQHRRPACSTRRSSRWSPTKRGSPWPWTTRRRQRYGPHVQGAGIHHNPTPGPAGSPYVYGHIWVVLGLLAVHPAWGVIALPLLARLYVRAKDLPGIDPKHRPEFRTKLEMGVELLRWARTLAEVPGQADLGGGRRGLRQGPVPQAGDGAGDDGRQPAAQGRGPVDRARAAGVRAGAAGRGSTGRTGSTLAKRAGQRRGWTTGVFDLYGKPSEEAVQDVPGDVAAGRRRDPGGAGGRADRVGGLLLHRRRRRAWPRSSRRWPTGSRWRPPSAIARRSSGPASSRCGSCGRTSVHSTSASGRSR